MKAFVVTDTHFGVRSGNTEWQTIQFDAFTKWIIPYIKEHFQEGDVILHCGDVFESRQSIPLRTLTLVEELLVELGKIGPVHIILGNHDCHEINSTKINSVKPFKWMPNIHLYEEPVMMEWGRRQVIMACIS